MNLSFICVLYLKMLAIFWSRIKIFTIFPLLFKISVLPASGLSFGSGVPILPTLTNRSSSTPFFEEPLSQLNFLGDNITAACRTSSSLGGWIVLEFWDPNTSQSNYDVIFLNENRDEDPEIREIGPNFTTVRQRVHLVHPDLIKIYCVELQESTRGGEQEVEGSSHRHTVAYDVKPIYSKAHSSPVFTVRPECLYNVTDPGEPCSKEFQPVDRNVFELKFLLGDVAETGFVCRAAGYPTPNIQLVNSTVSDLSIYDIEVSEDHFSQTSSIRIIFDRRGRVASNFTFRAYNFDSRGTEQEAWIRIHIDAQKWPAGMEVSAIYSWLVIGFAAVVVSVFVLATVYLFCINNRLNKRIRNLTKEEVDDFKNGVAGIQPEGEDEDEISVEQAAISLPFTRIIDPHDLIVVKASILGRGEFGIVYRGFLTGQPVAVKTVERQGDTGLLKEFLRELKIISYLGSHPHIVEFLGADISKLEQRLVYGVFELSSPGNLKNHLSCQTLREEIPSVEGRRKMFSWCWDIADGMEYLQSRKVIHADLATRNVLLFLVPRNLVKISDFGLSRQLVKYAMYNKKNSNAALPFAWMAIESLTKREFSHCSDVWSFGVVMWEIFTLGQEPFAEYTWDTEFIHGIQKGSLRLEKPVLANDFLYREMCQCWNFYPQLRPTFGSLKRFLERQIKLHSNGGEVINPRVRTVSAPYVQISCDMPETTNCKDFDAVR